LIFWGILVDISGVGMQYLIGAKLYMIRIPAVGDTSDAGRLGKGKVVID
jgi:hypothetical protein